MIGRFDLYYPLTLENPFSSNYFNSKIILKTKFKNKKYSTHL